MRARFGQSPSTNALRSDLLAMLQLFLELSGTGGRDRKPIHLILFKAELKRGASLRTLRASSDSSLGLPQGRPLSRCQAKYSCQSRTCRSGPPNIGRDCLQNRSISLLPIVGVVWHPMQEGCAAKASREIGKSELDSYGVSTRSTFARS